MRACRIACIAGNGIGRETTGATLAVPERVQSAHDGPHLDLTYLDWSRDHYLRHGRIDARRRDRATPQP